VQREQVMLPLKVVESRNRYRWCNGRWFPQTSRQQRLARIGKREEPPRDLRPRRALQRECVVTMEIPTLARAVSAQFRTSLNSEDGTGGVGKSGAPIGAMISGNAEGAKGAPV
jgi:hypothetical protein